MQAMTLADAPVSVANYRDLLALYTIARNVGASALQVGNRWDLLPAPWATIHGTMTQLYQRIAREIGREDLRTRDLFLLTPEGAANAAIDLVGTIRDDFETLVSSRSGQPVAMVEYLQAGGRAGTALAASSRRTALLVLGSIVLVAAAGGITYAVTRQGGRVRRR